MQTERLTNSNFDKMIIESIDEVMGFDKETGDLLFWFDQIKSGELTSENETVYAEGRQGVQLAAFDRNKTAGFSCENGYVVASALASQLGSEVVVASATNKLVIQVMDKFDVKVTREFSGSGENKTATIKSTTLTRIDPTPATGKASYLSADPKDSTKVKGFVIGSDNTKIATLDLTVSGNSGEKTFTMTYDPCGKDDVSTTEKSYTLLVVYDTEVTTGKQIINSGDKFNKNVKLVINFVAQEPCGGTKYLMQCIMPNAKASATFNLSAGDDPAVHNFEATALLDICSVNKELFTITMA